MVTFITQTPLIGGYGDQSLSASASGTDPYELWILWGDVDSTLGDRYPDPVTGTSSLIGGDDTLTGSKDAARNSLYGDAYSIEGAEPSSLTSFNGAEGGNDTLKGGSSAGISGALVPDPWEYGNFLFGDAFLISGGATTTTAASTKKAKGGKDVLYGGYQGLYEYLYGDAYSMRGLTDGRSDINYNVYVLGEDDVLVGGTGTRFSGLYGDAAEATDVVRLGNDILIGANGNQRQILVGDADTMGGTSGATANSNTPIQVKGGDDRLWGGNDASRWDPSNSARDIFLVGDGFTMNKGAEGGKDFLYSSGAHLWFTNFESVDFNLYNGYITYMIGDAYTAFKDYVPGEDKLFSGPGKDYMWGENIEGSSKGKPDSFIFTSVDYTGEDQIVDFDFKRNANIVSDSLVLTGDFWDISGLIDYNSSGGPDDSDRFAWLQSKIVTANIPASSTYLVFNNGSTNGGRISSIYIYDIPSNVLLNNTWESFRAAYPTTILFEDPDTSSFLPEPPPPLYSPLPAPM